MKEETWRLQIFNPAQSYLSLLKNMTQIISFPFTHFFKGRANQCPDNKLKGESIYCVNHKRAGKK